MTAIIQVNGIDILSTTRLVSGERQDKYDKHCGIDIDCLELLSGKNSFDVSTEVLKDFGDFEGVYSISSMDGKFSLNARLQFNDADECNFSISVEKRETKESIGTRDSYECKDRSASKFLKSIGCKVLIGYLVDDILLHQEQQVIDRYKKDKSIRRVP